VLAFVAAFLIALVILVAAGGYLWWRHYQTTPAYSLALLIDAGQRNDMAALEKHIDDEEIAKNMMASVSEKAAGRYGVALSGSLRSQIDKLLPSLGPRLKQTVHEEVAREIKEFAAQSTSKPFIVVALAVPTMATITTKGDTAKASATIRDRTIELSLHRDGDLWKVVGVNDDVLVQRVVDDIVKELPAIGGADSSDGGKPGKRRGKSAVPPQTENKR
jgi:hypothetical protein